MLANDEERKRRHLEVARQKEEERRPVRAALVVKDGAAVLRLLDRDGQVSADRYRIMLPGSVEYLYGGVLTLAEEFIAAAGFRRDGGWNDPTEWTTPEGEAAYTPIDVTPEYLAFVERKFSPPPPLGDRPQGLSAHRKGWGSWQLCYENRRFYDLRWTAKLRGPEWTLSADRAGKDATEHESAQDAMAAVVERVKRSDAEWAQRREQR